MADLNALYSYQGQEPRPLPHEISWQDPWGMTYRTGVESFTEEEIQRAGYTGPYTIPTIDQEYQRLKWDPETLTVSILDIPHEFIWENVKKIRNEKLFMSDWTQINDNKLSDQKKEEWKNYRQFLRDIPQLYDDPTKIEFPTQPD